MSTKPYSEYCYKRDRKLARTLGGRVFATVDGRLQLVNSQPDFHRLKECLVRQRGVPAPGQSPTPPNLGFPVICDGELTKQTLNVCGRALKRWEGLVERRLKRRAHRGLKLSDVRCEHLEIQQLRDRLKTLHAWRKLSSTGEQPTGSPYLLDTEQERELCRLVSGKRWPALTVWFARVAYWIAGPTATHRLLQAAEPQLELSEAPEQVAALRALVEQLHVLNKRATSERHPLLHQELSRALNHLPTGMRSRFKLTRKFQGSGFVDHLKLLTERCQTGLQKLKELSQCRGVAALTALVSSDGAVTAIPTRFMRNALRESDHKSIETATATLFDQSLQEGYDSLLITLDQLSQLPDAEDFHSVRCLVNGGATLVDIDWLQDRADFGMIANPHLSLTWLRGFVDELDRRALPLSRNDLNRMIEGIEDRRDVHVLDGFRNVLNSVPANVYRPLIVAGARTALLDRVQRGMTRLRCHGRLNAWSANVLAAGKLPDAPELPAEVRPWIGRLLRLRRLNGELETLPKSLRSLIERRQREQREIDFLQRQLNEGNTNSGMHDRLQWLKRRTVSDTGNSSRQLLRKTQESFITLAFRSLEGVINHAARDVWVSQIGSVPNGIAANRRESYAYWIQRMSDSHKRMLKELIQVWQRHGRKYKRYLPANRNWLEGARRHGIDLSVWLSPAAFTTVVEGCRIKIEIVLDPFEIFWMGEYFGTCLSFDGCNAMSPLANAYEANKQVLFAWDEHGQVLARQIISISSSYQMLRYHCYVNAPLAQATKREAIEEAIAAWCAQWASQIGIPLADEGDPDEIAGDVWYDDGEVEWPVKARAVWNRHAKSVSDPAAAYEASL